MRAILQKIKDIEADLAQLREMVKNEYVCKIKRVKA